MGKSIWCFSRYLGTVILGSLAFWQNERTNKMNEVLLENEKARNTPLFQFTYTSGTNTGCSFTISNASPNVACDVIISDLILSILKNDKEVSIEEYPLISVQPSYLGPFEKKEIKFKGNPYFYSINDNTGEIKLNIFATDILGVRRKTSVIIKSKNLGNYKSSFSYNIKEIVDKKN